MQKADETSLGFNLRRLLRALRKLAGTRMAVVGLVLLALSISVAVAAPLVFPFDPQKNIVGGQYAKPEWVMWFPDGYYLSKNIVVVNDPTFRNPSSIQEWTPTFDPAQRPNLSVSHATIGALGSIQVASSASSPTMVTVAKTFQYPYHGPPQKFIAQILGGGPFQVYAQGVSKSQPVQVRFFINKGLAPEKSFTLWSTNITQNGMWQGPRYSLDSTLVDFQTAIGLITTSGVYVTSLDPAAVIFSAVDDYSYGFQVTFYGPSQVNVSSLGLNLYGTAYGLLGTDNLGNDLFAQNVWGARISLFVGLLSAFIGVALGVIIGLIAGYKTGLTDEALMRFTDALLVIPFLPLLIVLVGVLGASIWNIIFVIGFLGWMGFARVIRSQVLSLKERPFIEAAKAAGASTRQILSKHIFPNIVSLTYVNLAISVPGAILTEAGLSFLGLFDPTVISWGRMVNNAQSNGALNIWWWVLPPGIAIAIVSVSFVLIGYSLDEIFNPKLRQRR